MEQTWRQAMRTKDLVPCAVVRLGERALIACLAYRAADGVWRAIGEWCWPSGVSLEWAGMGAVAFEVVEAMSSAG